MRHRLTFFNSHPQRVVYLVLLTLSIVLAGCGRPDNPTAGLPGATSNTQANLASTTTATPTGPELDATKQAFDNRVQSVKATAQALPSPTPGGIPIPTSPPQIVPPETGLSLDCLGILNHEFHPTNCWREVINNQYVGAFAGVSANDATEGWLVVLAVNATEAVGSRPNIYKTPTKAGSVTIQQVNYPRVTLQADNGTMFVFNMDTRTWEDLNTEPTPTAIATATPPTAVACDLYPVAFHAKTASGASIGQTIPDILNGTGKGNFGWLTWAGGQSTLTLVTSLTPPGDSSTYVNPDAPADHQVSMGDWVQARPGVDNSQAVRETLGALQSRSITVPIWDRATGQGSKLRYHIVSFAQIQITDYRLPGQNRISAIYQGPASCSVH